MGQIVKKKKKKICLQCRRPWFGKIPWRRKWQPTPVFLPGKARGQRSLVGYGPWGCKELDTTERRRLRTAEPGGTSLTETQRPPDLRASVGPCECCPHACGLMPRQALCPVSVLMHSDAQLQEWRQLAGCWPLRTEPLGTGSPPLWMAACGRVYIIHVYVLVCSLVSNSFATPGNVARQAPLSLGFPRQEYWSGSPSPPLKECVCSSRNLDMN